MTEQLPNLVNGRNEISSAAESAPQFLFLRTFFIVPKFAAFLEIKWYSVLRSTPEYE